MRKWIKWIGIIFLIPIGLVLLLAILLYLPPVQNFAVKQATKYASEATGMQIGLERIRLSFPLDVTVNGIEVLTTPTDTLLTLQEISVRVNPLPLVRKIVSVESLHLEDAWINSGDFVKGMLIKGNIQELSARADYISLNNEEATLNSLDLSGANIALRIDSVSQDTDTTTTPLNWKIRIGDVDINRLAFDLNMPLDTLRMLAFINKGTIGNGLVDLGLSRYTVERFNLSDTNLSYDGDTLVAMAGLDPAHIAVTNLQADLRSIVYQDKDIEADIRTFSLEERSGLVVSSFTGSVKSDSIRIDVPQLNLKTPYSDIMLSANVPWSIIEENATGDISATVKASVGKTDVFTLVPDMPADFKRAFPTQPITVDASVNGSLEAMDIQELKAEIPGAIRLTASGKVGAVMDSVRRSADIQFQAVTQNMNFVMAYLPAAQREQFRIPSGIRLNGHASLKNQQLQANARITEDKANILLAAQYNMASEAYAADLKIDSLEPIHFMPHDSIMWVSAAIKAEGRGTDIYSPATWAEFSGSIDSVQYVNTTLADVTFSGSLKENKAHVELNSDNPAADINLMVDGTIQRDEVEGIVIIDADNIDLYALQLMDSTFTTSFQLFAEAKSDLKETNSVDVTIGNWQLLTAGQRVRPKVLTLLARTTPDTTRVSLHTGDLGVVLTGNAGLNSMIDQFSAIANDVNRQLTVDSTVNIAALRPSLPDMDLSIKAGRDNPIYNILQRSYISFTNISIYASTSPEDGIQMDAGVYAFARDTFLIDTIRAQIRPDTAGLLFSVDVIKNKYRQQIPFTAHVNGSLQNRYADAELLFKNHNNETGLLLGVRARKETEGYSFQLYPDRPVIAFNTFDLNPDNYVRFRSMSDIEADIRLTGNENASLWIHSTPSDGPYPELMVEIGQLNLGRLSEGLAMIPDMQGILSANVRYAPTTETFMVVADANIDDLYYEGGRVGEIMLNAVYLPLENSQHQFDVHMYHDRAEIATATALLQTNNINGSVDFATLPLAMANAFIPDNMAQMNGALNGNMTIEGSTSKPVLNGYMQLDTASVFIGMADTRLRFDDKRITVDNSLISFDKYNIYAANDNPFIIDGTVNMSDLSRMMADLRLTANNMQVLDARRTSESMVYGQLLMNFNSTIKGPFTGLTVRGDAQVLGGTDVTYVLTDSPLTVQDRMEGLVTFTSFTDTLTRQRRPVDQLPVSGIDMLMVLHIDPTVQFRVDITPDQSNYAEVEGGGDLSFQITRQGDMVLNGRYTFSEGIVNYSLPVVPLKEFKIHPDSYVQWDGEVLNPLINVVATERMRATINEDDASRRVNFDVGISVQDRLDNMQMSFIIDAVDDSSIRAELASLGEDERTRRAVYMMVTGTYLGTGSGSGGFNVGGAVGSFLAGEINNIAGDALKDVDIDIGFDSYDTGGGQTQNDLTFSFAKRFYNDRIRVSIGGRVSTGGNAQEAESFLDNFAAEYLLDPAGSRTVKFFYDKNYENILEGEVIETGVGLVLRKKVLRLRELFDFRKKKVQIVDDAIDDAEERVPRASINELETRPEPNEEEETNNE